MPELTEERLREIVREEIAKYFEEQAFKYPIMVPKDRTQPKSQ